jgi:cell division inhibitor SepF
MDKWNGIEEAEEDEEKSEETAEEEISSYKFRESSAQSKVVNFAQRSTKIICTRPDGYDSEILSIADELIDGNIVIIDLKIENERPEIAVRILDFLRGVVHAKRGKFISPSKGTYVMAPLNVEINGAKLLGEINEIVSSEF